MRHIAGAFLVAAAGLFFAPQVAANPIVSCLPGVTDVAGQTVEVGYEVASGMGPTTLDIYRGPKGVDFDLDTPNIVFVTHVTGQDGTPSTGDTGSGVVDTVAFVVTEQCVPKGGWRYKGFTESGYDAACLYGNVDVSEDDPACSAGSGGAGGGAAAVLLDDPDDAGCAVGGGVAPPPGAAGVGLAALLGLLWRRRRRD